jgi:hypothetical protein
MIIILQFIFIAVFAVICGFLNEYSIETIALFFGKTVDFPYWIALLLGFFPGLGQVCIPVAAIVFVLTFIL